MHLVYLQRGVLARTIDRPAAQFEIHTLSRFTGAMRQLERYRHGRVLVDSHHAPTAAQVLHHTSAQRALANPGGAGQGETRWRTHSSPPSAPPARQAPAQDEQGLVGRVGLEPTAKGL